MAKDSLVVIEPEKQNERKFPYKQLIVPVGLVAAGAILKIPSIEDNLQENSRKLFGEKPNIRVDDYIQYAPAVLIFAGGSLGFKSRHTYKQMAANVAVSSAITGSIIYISKTGFGSLRPDGSSNNSFPSGHSALAFNLATLQFLEYKDANIWYASSGYVFAVATAVMRVGNNRHWCGDVLKGAGLGIGIAVLVNYWNPLSKFTAAKISGKQISVRAYPVISQNTYGAGVTIDIDHPHL
ncbi:phosphatase PAP2 family protein [Chryseobacterium sp. DT-3]|uniref:phosphatase PAP2 family protein n=1 Tax=Chryseobacterium sp. DT-3 TaxID=3396164 RepID=UPI003F1D5D75